MLKNAIRPPSFYRSVYGPEPRQKRASSLPGIVSLGVRDLFPNIAPAIYRPGDDLAVIRKATEKALAGVDIGMIGARDTVNVVSCEHGFSIMGGEPYVEMLKTIKDFVQERASCKNIRLRVGAWQGFREASEVIDHFRLEEYFGKGNVAGFGPWDKGVPIETEIGTVYGIKKVYDGDWFIHAYYDDAREIHLHRYLHRPLKAFITAFARIETRGLYHCFPTRSGAFLPRAVFDSPFVQRRYAFACLLRSSPAGITGIDADNDLYQIDRRITVEHLKDYSRIQELFNAIDECVGVVDGGRWMYYLTSGGLVFSAFFFATHDYFDLSNPVTSAGFDLPDPHATGALNPAVKAIVINQAWRGIPLTGICMQIPTILVGKDMADMFATDASSPGLLDVVTTAETLEEAVGLAQQIAKTDKLIVFDGSFGHFNLSPSLGEYLIQKAPEVNRKVEKLLPVWLKQRGIDPATV